MTTMQTMDTGAPATDPSPAGHPPTDHPAVPGAKIGVLMVNLGTPSGTDYWSMRRYLSEFLSDRRVIEVPRWIWQPILQLMVLSRRPKSSGHAYRSIWRTETDESPLLYFTRTTAEMMQARHRDQGVVFDFAMRYGRPSIPERLTAMKAAGCNRILVLPLYPQYSATTTGTVVDKVCDALKAMRWQPAVRIAPTFHDHPVYIAEIAESIRRQAAGMDRRPDRVLLSFHGLPRSYLDRGDPYHCYCQKTGRLVGEHLARHGLDCEVSFQSRFGPQEWLQPYTVERLKALPGEGVKTLMVASPGFVADCVETLEEISIAGREEFLGAGGEVFEYVPCLNTSDGAMALFSALCRTELAGWIDLDEAAARPLAAE